MITASRVFGSFSLNLKHNASSTASAIEMKCARKHADHMDSAFSPK